MCCSVNVSVGGPLHSANSFPTSTGAVYKSVTISCVLIFVQLNMCVVVCGSALHRGHSGEGCISASIVFK